ncbi:MAG TPA: hypothetical protein GXX56_07875 [Rhodocyclaceae bacterium]|nr:hypothetical protein [Rhodocyclaceae bacterium]
MVCPGQKKTATPWRVALGAVLALLTGLAAAVEPVPVVVAESESFEIVGRWYEDGLRLYVDAAPDNTPVLAAQLTVEAQGEEIVAAYDAAAGLYRIDDAAWLARLRAAGAHPLAFTVLTDETADVLAGDLVVGSVASPGVAAAGDAHGMRWLVLLAGVGALVVALAWRWRGKRGEA